MTPLQASLALCTALLGLFIAIPLLLLGRRRRATPWLGGFVYAIASLSLADYVRDVPTLFGFLDWPVTCLGAFYYLYVRAVTGLGNGRAQAMHFAPLAIGLPILFWIRAVQLDPLHSHAQAHLAWVLFSWLLIVSQGLAISYAVAMLWRLAQYRRRVRECFASTTDRDLRWLVWLAATTLVLLIVWVPSTMVGGAFLVALSLGRIGLLFFVGWFGLQQVDVFLPDLRAPPLETPVLASPLAPDLVFPGAPASNDPPPPKYLRSGMTESARQLIGERLESRMRREREYLESDITLAELAERLGTSPQLLSQYLNDVLGMSFFDYINGLRVAEVQRAMTLGDRRTLIDLAFAAGFNSKSTFNASFKRVTGQAPSEWRKTLDKAA